MELQITERELEAMLLQRAEVRYTYFVKRVVDWGEVWVLNNDGLAMVSDENGSRLVPTWPAKRFAEICSVDEWSAYSPMAITISDFIESLLPNLFKDDVEIAVFYTLADFGVRTGPERLRIDLESEMAKYD